ncbi:MAG TPA: PepSY-like domain-containing protein [Salinimicrobium sp.]|nr:PepSY-like domain-containing protein [Salinimicrobium sp.]
MRKLVLTVILAAFAIPAVSAQNGAENLPQEARDFIDEHFATETVSRVEKEDSWFSWDKNEMYEVYFSNGLRLDFNKQGEITEISGEDGISLPQEAFPAALISYINSNYPGTQPESWEREDDKQEVELSDGTELEFDLDGNFLKAD